MHSSALRLALAGAFLLSACDGDNGGPFVETFEASLTGAGEPHEQFASALVSGEEPHQQFRAALSGAEEVPPVTTSASGSSTFTAVGSTISFTLDVADIDNATAAHIHKGAPGVNGGVMVTLFAGPTTDAGFTDRLAEGEVEVADSVLELMRAGEAYVNVHTEANPGGEIRGQVELVETDATGTADFNLLGSTLTFDLSVTGIDSATAAHIHAGAAGEAGGVIVPLFAGPTTEANFSGELASGEVEIVDSVAARMRAGTAYVNVHTIADPLGAIRGQVRPVTSTATGTAAFTLRGNDLGYAISVSSIDSATAAHIHLGEEGVSGPILVNLFTGPTTGTNFSGILASGTVMIPDSVITHMRAGRTYVNVHTTAIPAGAIRGELRN